MATGAGAQAPQATSGCTWNQLPPVFGLSGDTAFRRFTEWTEARVLHEPGGPQDRPRVEEARYNSRCTIPTAARPLGTADRRGVAFGVHALPSVVRICR